MYPYRELELLIVGFGGAGQTYFMEFCRGQHIQTNCPHDGDRLKHARSPQDIPTKIHKCIYVYNHPYYSLRSHYRRGWAMDQIYKLGNPHCVEHTRMGYRRIMKNIIRRKQDLFGMESHFQKWIDTVADFPILFLDFREILSQQAVIHRFLDKPLDFSLFVLAERTVYTIDRIRALYFYDGVYQSMKRQSLEYNTCQVHWKREIPHKHKSVYILANMSTSSIYAEYFQLTDEYIQKYGPRTVVLMQVGTFYEIYGVKRSDGTLDKSIIDEVSLHGNLAVTEKKNSNDRFVAYENEGNVVCSGFRDYSLEKYLPKLTDNGITAVVFVQETDGKKFKRVFHSVYSPGTYLSYEADTSSRMTNHAMCIWIDIIQPRLTKSASVVGERTRDILVYCAAVVNIFTGQSALFEHQTVHLMNPTTFDELERFVSVYSPSEVIFVSPLPIHQTTQIMQYAGIKTTTIHRIDSTDVSNDTIQRCMQQKYLKYMVSLFYDEDTYDQHPDFYEYPVATQSFCYLLHFIQEHNPYLIRKIVLPYFHNTSQHMILANHTLKQLNIIDDTNAIEETHHRKWGIGGITSVASFLNKCLTPMGRRSFYSQIVNPTFDEAWLCGEYDILSTMMLPANDHWVPFLRIQLREVGDLEKIGRQITARRIYPSSIYKLFQSLQTIQQIHLCFSESRDLCEYLGKSISWNSLEAGDSYVRFDKILSQLTELISRNLVVEKCKDVQSMQSFEENIICLGVSPKLDGLLEKQKTNQQLLDAIHQSLNAILRKQENTPNMEYVKIHETDKLGGSLQITKKRGVLFKKYLGELIQKNAHACVPITPTVSILASDIKLTSGANKTNDEIEFPLLNRLCREMQEMKDQVNQSIQQVYAEFLETFEKNGFEHLAIVSKYIARLDILQSKTYMAKEYHYCRPELVSNVGGEGGAAAEPLPSFVKAYGLRHCLIEHIQQNELYVANDVCLGDCSGNSGDSTPDKETMSGMLLYGVNAVGKTSLIRALGIAVIMAQAGMFVPCSRFVYRPYRSIYSRILGNDNLFKGLSTFAVEMSELRMILKMSDANSLILGDELCSGTETESALSIFTAGLMDLHEKRASFIFATHFHEILKFEEIARLDRLSVQHMAVHFDREKDCLIYDRKLMPGVGPCSYGIEVCKSLYLPESFLEKTYEIRNKYFPKNQGGLHHGPAKTYNAQKIRGLCERCRVEIGNETHHLLEQQIADANGFIGGVHKNHPANLMSLCEKCHAEVHAASASLAVRKKTTKGYKI